MTLNSQNYSTTAQNLAVNSDWDLAISKIKTILPLDLFQKLEKSCVISRFVQTVFCQYPVLASEALIFQYELEEKSTNKLLLDCYQAFGPIDADSEPQIMQRLRVFRRIHSAAIAVLELTDSITIESSCVKISALADVLIKAAYQWSYQFNQQRFGTPLVCDGAVVEGSDCEEPICEGTDSEGQPLNLIILAMGKLGGSELNFSSDVDLIFFFQQNGQTQGGSRSIEYQKFFTKVATLLIKLLDDVTSDGWVYRVDMRLRPYGDSGALVASFAQAEDYYQEQGREWERFALLRARFLTGTQAEQKQLEEIIRPFSFRRYIDYGVIESIRAMKEMIQREVRRKGLVGNIKLGAGGIREIEFMVQSMQLIQGGRDKRLREKNTLAVLPLLVDAKLLPLEVADELAQSYRFLRRVEHCLQQFDDKQTQQLPSSDIEQKALSQALHFEDWSQLKKQIDLIQHQVNQHFNQLFGEDRKNQLSPDDFYISLSEGHITSQQLFDRLNTTQVESSQHDSIASLDLKTCENYLLQLTQFYKDPAVINLSSRGAKRLKTFFPSLLAASLECENPDITLARLLKVLQSIIKRTAYLELLSENQPILQHLVDLVGRSPWVVSRLSDYPVLFDELLYPNSLYEPLQTADLQAELRQNLLRIEPTDEEALLDTLRSFKQTNELRVAAALLAQRLSISQVSRYLTQLAEVVLQATIKHCWHLLTLKHGAPEGVEQNGKNYGFAVIGYGKLGGYELGFGSDLDLVFLFDQPVESQTNGKRPLNNSRFYTRLAQKIIHFLSTRTNLGMLYEVDMRLRPSGASGLLVSHIDAYRDYQRESAWTWEHQALVRARFVAGDDSLGKEFEQIRFITLSQRRDQEKLQCDVLEMRQKMREQLEKKQENKIDLKQTAGGLVDIEFLAQYFSLSNGYCDACQPNEIPNNTVAAIKMAAQKKLLSQDDSLCLIKNYRLFRNQLNEMSLQEAGGLINAELFAEQINKVKRIWKKILPGDTQH